MKPGRVENPDLLMDIAAKAIFVNRSSTARTKSPTEPAQDHTEPARPRGAYGVAGHRACQAYGVLATGTAQNQISGNAVPLRPDPQTGQPPGTVAGREWCRASYSYERGCRKNPMRAYLPRPDHTGKGTEYPGNISLPVARGLSKGSIAHLRGERGELWRLT